MEELIAAPAETARLRGAALRTRLRFPADRLHAYISAVTLFAALSLVLPPAWWQPVEVWLPAAIALTIVSTVLEFQSVPMPRGGDLSIATITHVATIVLVPMPFSGLSVGVSLLIHELVRRSPRDRALFNVSSFVLTAAIASAASGVFGDVWTASAGTPPNHVMLMWIMVAVGGTYYLVNTLLINIVISIALAQPLMFLIRANARNTGLSEVGAATVGGLGALIWTVEPLWTTLLAVPTAVISRSLQYIRQLEQETRSAVRSLARLVDDRDSSTYHHSERVSAYAEALARELGLPEDEVDVVSQAAGVHDLGKIGVPDRILLKPGPLDDDERRQMWLHTEIGARVLANFQLFRAGTSIVLHHHENYDGTGYPGRLAGDQIPLGARIVAVTDAFDAMTSNRPYRRGMTVEEALDRLRAGSGTQWDPKVVGAFITLVLEDRLPHPDPEESEGSETEPRAVSATSGPGDAPLIAHTHEHGLDNHHAALPLHEHDVADGVAHRHPHVHRAGEPLEHPELVEHIAAAANIGTAAANPRE